MKRILILGAGPAGLAAGKRLRELGHTNFHIYERSGKAGGLAASFRDEKGFLWDSGGHVIFSHFEYYDRLLRETLGDEFVSLKRDASIYMLNRYVPYPFQNNLRHLPPDVIHECVDGLRNAPLETGATDNFRDWIDAHMGEGIARHFMLPYNEKVWAYPLEKMSAGWMSERVSRVTANEVIKNLKREDSNGSWGPNAFFLYPKRGGFGSVYGELADHLSGFISYDREVTAIDTTARRILCKDGAAAGYDEIISTMPLDQFVNLSDGLPEEVKKQASRLQHNSLFAVGIGVEGGRKHGKSWIYFPEDGFAFNRVTCLSNYSDDVVPQAGNFTSFLCEVTYSPSKPVPAETVVEKTIEGLLACGLLDPDEKKRIASRDCRNVPYAYPIPTKDRDEILVRIQPELEARHIYSRGRFGSWKYEAGNTDHAVEQGREIAERLVNGKPESLEAGLAPEKKTS